MKKAIGITAIISGLFLIVVPRYVLPACEYAGFSRMHCSETAGAEAVLGTALALTGLAALVLKQRSGIVGAGVLSFVLAATSLFLPGIFGYCRSSRMPCNYGMVPGIRLIGIIAAAVMLLAMVLEWKRTGKKGNQ